MDWRFWRWFRRNASHANTEEMPAAVIRAEKRSSRFSIAETCFGILVVAGVLYEDWDNLPMIVHPNSPAGRMAIGGIVVAFGIVAEVWSSSRSSKAEHEVRDWYAMRVAELNLQRAKIEEKLLRTLGPRKIDDAKRESLAHLTQELLPTSSFLVMLCPQKNNEDQREALDFAWQLAEIFRCAVCSTNQDMRWEVEDVWIRPSAIDSSEVREGTARAVAGILRLGNIAYHGPIPAVLPSEFVYMLERGTGRIAGFLKSEDVLRPLLIVVGKKSQPVFRLDD